MVCCARSSAPSFHSLDIPLLRKGDKLGSKACALLIQPVTRAEIDQVLHNIDDNKASGLGGSKRVFFKKTWHTIQNEVHDDVLKFFISFKILKQFNCTPITLVPKSSNPSTIKDYRPIACCSRI